MTLAKAIEIGGDNVWDYIPEHNIDSRNAIKLLMEAGKRILRQRTLTIPIIQPPLPGEDIV